MPRKKPRKPKRAAPRKAPAKRRASKKPAPPLSAPPAAAAADYGRHRAAAAGRQALQSLAGRDIGPIRPIADLKRRESCRDDPEKFLLTYNAPAFGLPFCQDHRDVIARVHEAFATGALSAFALPRGAGKSTLCRGLALWAIGYRFLRYLVMLGATAGKAQDSLAAIKTYTRFLPEFRADFPEICQAVEALGGVANRASGQLCNGQPTMIEWGADRIVLPTVPPPPNWPKRWPLRDDGLAPTSGSVIGTSGITGDGIRGTLVTTSAGEPLRPDGVLIDDINTNESAHSATQNATRLQLIAADVLGMAGPGRTIAGVAPMTVIADGDAADQLLDRKRNPAWRGERRGVLKSMPVNMEAWAAYFEVYFRCAQQEPPDYEAANAYYCAHRRQLDEGAEASWPERKLPHEISAIQHAMHWYARDPYAFWSEGMNRPRKRTMGGEQLDSVKLAARVNGLAAEIVPLDATLLTAGVDVGQNVLWYVCVAWNPATFAGSVIAYGAWPDQQREYFTAADARITLGSLAPEADVEGAVSAGLTSLWDWMLPREWFNERGTPLKISQLLCDSRWKPDLICAQCRRSPHAAVILPSQGRYVGAKSVKQWHQFDPRPGERLGLHWAIGPLATSKRAIRVASVDVNFWKTQLAQKLSMPPANRGAVTIWGQAGQQHQMLADHWTAESFTDVTAHNRTVREWSVRPDRKDANHLWDCLVYAAAAASIQGCVLPSVTEARPPAGPTEKWSERARKKWAGR